MTTKTPVKKTPTKKAPKAVSERMTKNQILTAISTEVDLTKKEVASVLDHLEHIINQHIKKRSVGEFVFPGLFKIKAVKKPATKKRKGRNPATGEEITIAAKPASTKVRILPLKKLKEMTQ